MFTNSSGSDNPSKGDTMSIIRNGAGVMLGKGYGASFKESRAGGGSNGYQEP